MRILVTDGTYKHTIGIVRSLGPRHEVFVASPHTLAAAAASRHARGHVRSPEPGDAEAFVGWLDRVVPRLGIEQVMPVGAASCRTLSTVRDRWPGVRIVLPPAETMLLALDKREAGRVAASVGVAVPRTAQPMGWGDLAEAAAAVGFPLVLKAPIEGPTGVAYVDDASSLEAAVRAFVDRSPEAGMPLLQQRIVGPGFGVFVTYQDGRLRRIMGHRRIRENPPTGGESSCCELADDPGLLDAGRRVMDALEWHGVAMVELKRHDTDGRYYLMEINPKFWGSLDLALAAGADFPGDLARIAAGEQLPEFDVPHGRLRFCWPLSSDLSHLVARPADLSSVLADWVDPRVATNVRPGDPLPNLVELGATLRRLMAG